MGLAGLTAVFGMGTGVAPPVSSPGSRTAGGQATPAASSLRVARRRSVGHAGGSHPGSASWGNGSNLAPDACRGVTLPGGSVPRRRRSASRGEAGGSGWSSRLAVRTGRLRRSPAVHSRPIDLVVFQEPTVPSGTRKPGFGGGFALRCLQRLSGPDLATRRCPERDSRHTRGRSSPILSY
jgi:hypothetical protein